MQTLFYALRPKLFPSKVFSFHTSSVTRLRRYSDDDKDDFELPMQGRPNRGRGPTQFSFFSIISRSAREARERRRDGVPAMVNLFSVIVQMTTDYYFTNRPPPPQPSFCTFHLIDVNPIYTLTSGS